MDFKREYKKYKLLYLGLKDKIENNSDKKSKSNEMVNQNSNSDDIESMEIEEIKPTYVEHLSEPWFALIDLGLKTVEGRKNKGRFKDMKVGDIVKWENDDFKHRSVLTRITAKTEYKTFEEYLRTEGLDKCLPGMNTIAHGLSVYFKYFTKEDEEKYGVVAIRLEKVED